MEMSEFQSYFPKRRLLRVFSPVKPEDVSSCKPDRLLADVPTVHGDEVLTATE